MAANKKPSRKVTKPAAQLPAVLQVKVRNNYGTSIARARGMTCSCTSSESLAVRGLARKLGYSSSADVRYQRTDDDRVQYFEIVEVGRAG